MEGSIVGTMTVITILTKGKAAYLTNKPTSNRRRERQPSSLRRFFFCENICVIDSMYSLSLHFTIEVRKQKTQLFLRIQYNKGIK